MTKNKSLLSTLLCFVIVFAIALIGVLSSNSANVAMAGNIDTTLIQDNFNDLSFSQDNQNWHTREEDYSGINHVQKDNPALWMEEPDRGDSLTSTVAVTTNNIRVQIDIKLIDFGSNAHNSGSGWFGVVYNLKDTNDGTAFNAEQNKTSESGDGVYFVYGSRSHKLMFTTINNTASSFVDKDGNDMPSQDSWRGTPLPYYDASMITDEPSGAGSTTITNKTITIDFENRGMAVYVKEMGTEGLGELVAKTKDGANTMEEISANTPYVALVATKYDAQYIRSLEFTEFKISDISGNTVFNSFAKENVSKYKSFKAGATKSLYFGVDTVLNFGEGFSNEYPYLANRAITINDYDDEMNSYVDIKGVLNVASIKQDSRFGLVTGVRGRMSAEVGMEKTTFTYFTKNNNVVSVGIKSYDEEGQEVSIFDPVEISGSEFEYNLHIDNKGKITLKIDGTKVYESTEDKEGYAAGYAGFALEGESEGLNINALEIKMDNLYYARPENDNLLANFEDDPTTPDIDESNSYNKNEWLFKTSWYLDGPTNTGYINDGKLVFNNNASGSSFSTHKQYSNFAFQTDFFGIRREPVKDANGNLNYPISNRVFIYWGVPYASWDSGIGVGTIYPMIYIEPDIDPVTWDRKEGTGLYLRARGLGLSYDAQLPEKYDYWDMENADKVLQIRVEVEEKNVVVKLKYTTETEWWTAAETQMSKTIIGCVGLGALGHNYYVPPNSTGYACAYYSADNISVTNLDNNPNLVKQEYATSKIPFPTDFDYVDKNDDDEYLIAGGVIAEEGCGSSINPEVIAVGSLVACAVLLIIKKLRRA